MPPSPGRGFERAQIAQWKGWIGLAGGVLGNRCGGLRVGITARSIIIDWLDARRIAEPYTCSPP